VVLVLGLLLMPSPVSAASGIEVTGRTGEGKWVGDTWKVEIYPGESMSTTISLYNSSSSSLGVEVSITPDPACSGNLTFELNKLAFAMSGKSYANVTLTARASGSATPGTYTAELVIKSEIPPAPTPSVGDGAGAPAYSIKTDLFGTEKTYYTERDGYILKTIEGTSQDGKLTITIPKRTTAQGENGRRLKTLGVVIDEAPPKPPEDTRIIGLAYNFTPAGATFDPPITFTWSYDPAGYVLGYVAEEDLVLAYYDEDAGKWVELDCVVDTKYKTITASVPHFTVFAIIGAVTPPPPPPLAPVPPEPEPAPAPVPTPAPEPEVPAPFNWWPLIGGIIGGVVVVGLLIFWLIRRARA